MRQIIGFTPVDDGESDELRNRNLNRSDNEVQMLPDPNQQPLPEEEIPEEYYEDYQY